MIADQGSKLVTLAEDIIANGISPLEAFGVLQDGRKYTVLEGNRRVTAIKLVAVPDLCAGTSVYKAFRKLSTAHASSIMKSVPCVVFESREKARIWIDRRHNKDLKGAGLETWDAEAKRRFNAESGKTDPVLSALDAVRSQSGLTKEVLENLNKVPTSTFDRILSDPYVKEKLGLEFDGGKVSSKRDKSGVMKILTAIADELGSKKIKVDDVRKKADRQKYIDAKIKAVKLDVSKAASEWTIGGENGTVAANAKTAKKTTALTVRRRTFGKVSFNIVESKPSAVFRELSKLNVEEMPIACAVLLRTFLELSCYHYQKIKGIGNTPQQELNKRITSVVAHMIKTGVATDKELKGASKAANNQHSLASTDTLNAYVHSAHFIPTPSDVRGAADQIEPLFAKIWP
jgi:hypothetical protein